MSLSRFDFYIDALKCNCLPSLFLIPIVYWDVSKTGKYNIYVGQIDGNHFEILSLNSNVNEHCLIKATYVA